jgi:DNA mismatch repair protein MutS2
VYLGQKINDLGENYLENNRKRELMNELFKLVQVENSKRQKVSLKQKRALKAKEIELQKEVDQKVDVIRKQKKKQKEIAALVPPKPKRVLVIGDSVRLEDGRAVGTLDKLEKNKAIVNYGLFTTTVSVDRLEYVKTKK